MKLLWCLVIPALAAGGCVTKSRADAETRAAYLAGQAAAFKSIGADSDVIVIGDVQKHEVPYVDGLTLAQAIATANYTGAHDPKMIFIRRHDVQIQIDPKALLNGQNVPLQAGDTVTIMGQ